MKLKRAALFFLIINFYCGINIFSQVNQEWVSKYNYYPAFEDQEKSESIAVDSFQNVYITGSTFNNYTLASVTIKYSSSGEQLWVKRFETAYSWGGKNKILLDNYSNPVVFYTDESIITKFDKTNGNIIWQLNIDTAFSKRSHESSAAIIDKNNNIIVCAFGGVLKISSSGNILWRVNSVPMCAITLDNNSNIYLTGGTQNFKTIKLNPNGEILWEFTFGGIGTSICLDALANVYVAGSNSVAKLTANGVYVWFHLLPGLGDGYNTGTPKLLMDPNGNLLMLGNKSNSQTNSNSFVLYKYSSSGNLFWNIAYNSQPNRQAVAYSFDVDKNGDIYVSGFISDGYPNEFSTIKYSSSGELKWFKKYSNLHFGCAYDIAVQYFDIFVTGFVESYPNGQEFITIKYSQIIGIEPINNEVPNKFTLHQNYPNPFNPVTKIKFGIPSLVRRGAGVVVLKIYDILGREVAALVNGQLKPGTYEVEWDGSEYASGVYFYKLVSGDFRETRKMALIK